MGAISAGNVVFVPLPFSDLGQTKVRAAVCLAAAGQIAYVAGTLQIRAFSRILDAVVQTIGP